MNALDAAALNAVFEKNEWLIYRELADFDGVYLSEDLAQYEKDGHILDFGFYGDGVEPAKGEFGIILIRKNNWESPIVNCRVKGKLFALGVLLQFATINPLELQRE